MTVNTSHNARTLKVAIQGYELYQRSLEAIIPLTDQLQILGEYQAGKY